MCLEGPLCLRTDCSWLCTEFQGTTRFLTLEAAALAPQAAPLSQLLLPLLRPPEAMGEPGQGSPAWGTAWGAVGMPDPGFPRPKGEGSGCLRAGGGPTPSSMWGPAPAQGTHLATRKSTGSLSSGSEAAARAEAGRHSRAPRLSVRGVMPSPGLRFSTCPVSLLLPALAPAGTVRGTREATEKTRACSWRAARPHLPV